MAENTHEVRSEVVHQQLKDDVLALTFSPQAQLQEDKLAVRYKVSRTPVREAMRKLLEEGLIQRKGRFYKVAELTPEEIRDLYEIRMALESLAVRLCIKHYEPKAMIHLSDLVDTQESARLAGDGVRFFHLDKAFHLQLAKLSGNQQLLHQLRVIHDKLSLVRAREREKIGWAERVVVEHQRIVSALSRCNAAAADAEINYHIDSSMRLHLGLLQRPTRSAGSTINKEQ